MQLAARVTRFINIAHALDHLLMLIYPTALLGTLGAAQAFGRPYGEMLELSLGGFIAFGAGSLPAGWLGDRWSRRNMMALFFFGAGISCILTGFAATPLMLFLGLTAIGLFGAIYHPVGTAMLVENADRIGRAIGVNGVWGNMGIAAAALASWGLTQWLGWRAAFFVPGIISLALGVAFLILVPNLPATGLRRAARAVRMPRAILLRAFIVLIVVTVVGGIVFNATTIAVPKLLAERLPAVENLPLAIGLLAAAVFATGAMSQLIIGRLVDKYPLKAAFVPLALSQAPCLLLVALAPQWALVPVAAMMMFSLFGQVTINDAMVAKYTDQAWRARVYAVRYFVSFAGNAFAVPLIGRLHDETGGFTLALEVLAGLALITLVAALAFPYRREELDPAPALVAAE
jgi:MFS family permease